MSNQIVFYFGKIYVVCVNHKHLPAALLITFLLVLGACNKNQRGTVFPVPGDDEEVEKRIVDKKDYTVDFSVGDSDDFHLANGYKNGYPFNCYWSRNAAKIENGKLNMSVYKENDTYYGAEYRAKQAKFHYGYYATRMKAANCPGVITSFFTYTHVPYWDEIDIEILGKNMRQVQFNYFAINKGGHDFVYDLWFDASEDFHEYGFDWQRDSITWYIDGIKVYQATVDIPTNPQQLMMNVWNCDDGEANWAGLFDESKLPVTAQYEFIAYIPANEAAI